MASNSSEPEPNKNLTRFLALHKAILEGNLKSVEVLSNSNESALEARITVNNDTALHVAVGTGKANHIVEYLLDKMSNDQVALQNDKGNTVLSIAATVGNVEAAQWIMKIQPELNNVANKFGRIPLLEAARHGHKKMTNYLLQFNENLLESTDKTGALFVKFVIDAGFYDMALDLIQRHKNLAKTDLNDCELAKKELNDCESLLSALARKPSAFSSARKLGLGLFDIWGSSTSFMMEKLLNNDRKSNEQKSLQLVKCLCKQITRIPDYESASKILKRPFLLAAELGVHEVVEEIIVSFPDAIWFSNEKKYNAFQLAVINRHEKVFNLVYQMCGHEHLLLESKDEEKNNILHLAGRLAPRNRLNFISGAALQMQRELDWFKQVRKIVPPSLMEEKNEDGETPAVVFTEKHRELVKEGEKWMKDAATSCSVVAALIATVVFAAAITVPGGNNDKGQPIFYGQNVFTVFGLSDGISLFSSIGSILMFLSVLTARYADDDFYIRLPMRFLCGLIMLFLSVVAMIIAAGVGIYLVFCDKKEWILISLTAVPFYVINLMLYSQIPLVLEIAFSTLRLSIFRKHSKRLRY